MNFRAWIAGGFALLGAAFYGSFTDEANAQLPFFNTGPVHIVTLKSSGGKFVVAEGGGGGVVNANRDKAAEWEQFVLIDLNGGDLMSGDKVNLRSWTGKYVVAEGGGGGVVNANRDKPAEWERFTIGKVGGTGKISSGDKISLRAHNGKFVVAENGGGSVVNANRSAVGPWETFTLGVMLRLTADPSPLSKAKEGSKSSPAPSSPSSPSGPVSIPGYTYLGVPRCDVKYEPSGYRIQDARGYACCATATGASSARCGQNKREYSPDCSQWAPHGVLMQPHGCYKKN